MNAPDADRWREAYNTEISTLIANGTWELVELPQDAKVVQSGWVFKVKLNPDNTIECYRSRLVAKGYSQRPGYDYTKVFAPTFQPASLRLITALAAKEGLKIRSVDISSAFTYGELDEVIYMKQPEAITREVPMLSVNCTSRSMASSSQPGNRTRNCTLSLTPWASNVF